MGERLVLGRPFSISPSSVRFTQDSVAMCFQNETQINQALEEIVEGKLTVKQFPHIRVLLVDGEYYSVDNRRLYVFRVLNILGKLPFVDVREANQFNREFTTENNGCHVRLRNMKDNNGRWIRVETFRHCSCAVGRNSNLPSWWDANRQCHKSQKTLTLPSPTLNVTRFPTTVYSIESDKSNRNITDRPASKTNTSERPSRSLSRNDSYSKYLQRSTAGEINSSRSDYGKVLDYESFIAPDSSIRTSSRKPASAVEQPEKASSHLKEIDLFSYLSITEATKPGHGSRDISTNAQPTKVFSKQYPAKHYPSSNSTSHLHAKQVNVPSRVVTQPKYTRGHQQTTYNEATSTQSRSNHSQVRSDNNADSHSNCFTSFLSCLCLCCNENDRSILIEE